MWAGAAASDGGMQTVKREQRQVGAVLRGRESVGRVRRVRIMVIVAMVLSVVMTALPGVTTAADASGTDPEVWSITPTSSASAPVDPGTQLTITGAGFMPNESPRISGVEFTEVPSGQVTPATGFRVLDDEHVVAIAPNHVSGLAQVTLQLFGGGEALSFPGPPTVSFTPDTSLSRDAYPDAAAYSHSFTDPFGQYQDWMSDPAYMPDDRRLSEMSLPGTHDSGAANTGSAAAKTQSIGISQQLDAGIRAFDLRIGQNNPNDALLPCNDELHLFHGNILGIGFFCFDPLDQVLGNMVQFLKDHPNEFIVAWYLSGGSPTGAGRVPGDACAALYNATEEGSLVYNGGSQNPTADAMRGKIVLVNAFSSAGGGGPTTDPSFSITHGNTTTLGGCNYDWFSTPIQESNMSNQDDYDMSAVSDRVAMRNKWNAIKAQFDATNEPLTPATRDTIFVNHLSATGVSASNLDGASPCFYSSGAHDCELPGSQVLSDSAPLGGSFRPLRYGSLEYSDDHPETSCGLTPSCHDMVWEGLYQLTDCSSVAGGSVCTPVYVGTNAMAEAYIAGSDLRREEDVNHPDASRRSPDFTGLMRTGIVLADFPGKNLIRATIAANANWVSEEATRPPDHAGYWYTQPVDLVVSCHGRFYDNDPGNPQVGCPRDADGFPRVVQTLETNGENVAALGYTVQDGHGNQVTSNRPTFAIDTRAPIVGTPAAIDIDATTLAGAPVTFSETFEANGGPFTGYNIETPGETFWIQVSDLTSGLESHACHLVGVPDWQKDEALTLSGTTQVSCSARDFAGNETLRSFEIRVHPTITGTPSVAPNGDGWSRQSVTVSFTCTGIGSGHACPNDQVFSTDGRFTAHASVSSLDGTLSATSDVPVNIDATPPAVNTQRRDVDATSPVGVAVDLGGIATDSGSGIRSSACTPASNTVFRIGDTAVSCSAEDVAGNTSSGSLTVHVRSGLEQATNLVAAVQGDVVLGPDAVAVEAAVRSGSKTKACNALAKFAVDLFAKTGGLGTLADTLTPMIGRIAGTAGGCPFQTPTTTTVTISPGAPVTGQKVTLTATVAAGAQVVSGGKVQFYVDGAPLGVPVAVKSGTVASPQGIATLTTTFTSLQASVSARYTGTSKHSPNSSGFTVLNLQPAATTTSLTAAPGIGPEYGQAVTMTATVKLVAPATAVATGEVRFVDGGGQFGPEVELGVVPLTKGVAKLTLANGLAVGTHHLRARFVPSVAFQDSDSPADSPFWLGYRADPADTVTSLSIPATAPGGSLTVSASVRTRRASPLVPVGAVTFLDKRKQPLGGPVVVDLFGNASLTVTGVPTGSLTVTAQFAGSDGNYAASTKTLTKAVTAVTGPTVIDSPLTEDNGLFGSSIAISGDTMVVGAPGNDPNGVVTGQVLGFHNGLVHVFRRVDGSWNEVARLSLSHARGNARLGTSVAIDGDTVVATARFDVAGDRYRGSAYVFTKPAGGWQDATESAELSGSDLATNENFDAVAVSGNHVVAGASCRSVDPNLCQGAVYVFDEPATGWASATESAQLTASNGGFLDRLGASVAISGSTIVAGAPNHNAFTGALYVFTAQSSTWHSGTETAQLSSSGAGNGVSGVGNAVAISGDTIVTGANDCNGLLADVFTAGPGGFVTGTESATLTTSPVAGWECNSSGQAVAVNGPGRIVVGTPEFVAPGAFGNNVIGAGYLFTGANGQWTQAARYAATTATPGLSAAVAVSGDSIVLGSPDAPVTDFTAAGKVMVIAR